MKAWLVGTLVAALGWTIVEKPAVEYEVKIETTGTVTLEVPEALLGHKVTMVRVVSAAEKVTTLVLKNGAWVEEREWPCDVTPQLRIDPDWDGTTLTLPEPPPTPLWRYEQ